MAHILKPKRALRLSLAIRIVALCIPLLLILLFLVMRTDPSRAEWAEQTIASPVRGALATMTSLGPLRYISVSEILIAACVAWIMIALVALVVELFRRTVQFRAVLRHLSLMVTVGAWIVSLFSWTWGIGYAGRSLAQETGLLSSGISVEDLAKVTALFAEKASEYSKKVPRDEDGRFNVPLRDIFEQSSAVYNGISSEFTVLDAPAYPPKPMLFSKIMSALGFTGVYYGFTGEANINVDAPAFTIPFTIAHEMAHQRGVHSEDEANFASIAACITSGNTVYAYSGYISGLLYLSDALYEAAPEAWFALSDILSEEVISDFAEQSAYWERYESPASKAASAMYDGFLKSHGQTLGVRSYGACVDLLVTWLAPSQASDAS
ncbi:MAG TPA: DUF3810 domain-containing protein [Papillibacter sp.]|jgi:hypothetical protein|nr:DUF3810 domain-containing protein [Papillibacter sp.]